MSGIFEMSATKKVKMLIGILTIATGFLVVKGSVILSPSPALAADGESFTWNCTYSGSETVSGFKWELNGNTIALILSPACTPFDTPGPPDSSLYEYDCLSASQATFTAKKISNRNNGNSWQCAVAAPGLIYSNNVTVTVQVSVSSASLTPPTRSIRENVKTTFTCETSTSRPAANITWYKESITGQIQMVTSEVSSNTVNVGDLEKSTSELKFMPSRSDNSSKIYCQALNIPGRTPVMSTKFQMDVQYSPESAPYIENYSDRSTYKVIENNQGELSCIIKGGNPLATLTWTCFNNGLSTEISGTTVTKTVTWSATRGPDRSCTCQSSHPIAGTQSVSVNVQVLYEPDRPVYKVKGNTISGPINFIDGKPSSVVCESNGKPDPDSYSWSKAGSSTTAGDTLTFYPVQKQDDGQYTCTAQNTMVLSSGGKQIGSNSSTVKINVLYAPKITTLDSKDIVAGSDVSVQCLATKGIPEYTTFKWTRNGDNRSWDAQTLYIQNVTKNDDMMYTCTVQNTMQPTGSSQEIGTDSGSFHLNVLYMASITSFVVKGSQRSSVTVDEKADVTFICTVDSNPGSSIAIQLPDKMFQRKENTKALSYNHQGATCLDTGVYTCSANNSHNRKNSEKKLSLFVRCYPRPLTQIKENVTSALRVQSSFIFKGLAYPIPTFTWLRKQETTWKELSSNSQLSISITGVNSNLTIKNVSQSDYGEYQLKIENEIDIFIQNYNLIPEGVPETPSEFKVIEEHVLDTSVLLQWKPGFDGGPEQTFILMYKTTSDQKWMNRTVRDTKKNVMNYTLDNLASETEYQVVIFSQNRVGDSVGRKNITFMTNVAEREPSNGNSAFIGGAAGGSAGLVLILLIVGVIALRRRGFFTKGKAYREEENSDRKPVHSAEDDYGMQDNPMYVSAGPRDQTTGGSGSSDAGAVYSTVDKERNKIDTNKNDVYAEVDKSKKKKGGNKDKKEKKGFLKDKKNKKMTQDVDIYENATTSELKDTTAKQKKYDEIIYENPEPTKPAARKTVNKDGLIYADLTFNDQPKGQKKLVIHGLDDMTEYVQVDFTKKAEPLPDSDDDNNPPK